MKDAKPLEVAAGLVFREGRVLLTRRHDEAHLGGLWEFPGGKRERGESLRGALRRELGEELGIQVEVGEVIARIHHRYPDQSVRLWFFRCRLVAGEPRPLGCQSLTWASPAELANYAFPAADEQLLARLQRQPELWEDSGSAVGR